MPKSIRLETARSKILLLVAVMFFAALNLAWIQQHYRATQWARSMHTAGIQRAVELEPGNADGHHLLGRFHHYAEQDVATALKYFQAATRLNPFEARYWLDMATAHQIVGDRPAMRKAIDQAAMVDPTTPSVAWEIGNFYLIEGETERALKKFHVVVANDPAAAATTFDLAWRATKDVDAILRWATPASVSAQMSLIEVLVKADQVEPAMKAWDSLAALKQPVAAQRLIPFIDFLIKSRKIEEASRIWDEMVKTEPLLQQDHAENLIVNGDFEREVVPGGFSWRLAVTSEVRNQISQREVKSGSAALEVEFRQPIQTAGFLQYVRVKPNSDYEFTAYVRLLEIESAAGPRWTIADAMENVVLTHGVEWRGTTFWKEETLRFRTGHNTRLVSVWMGRSNSSPLIKGKLWVDKVRMVKRS